MARKIVFPIVINGRHFGDINDLYEYYYNCDPKTLTEFSKPFWAEGINLTELIHFPEKFTIVKTYNHDTHNRE